MRQLFLALILLSSTAYAVKCPDAASAAAGVRVSRDELLKVEVGSEGMDPSVQPTAQAQISVLKDRLVQFADAVVACISTTQTSVDSVEKALADHLGPHELERVMQAPKGVDESIDRIFGSDITPIVSAPRPSFLFIELNFGIACGSDSVLLLYRQLGGRWKRILRWQSQPYDKASGAFGDFFQYSLINDAKTNELAVVSAHGHPWCTSRWSGFNIDVLIPETGSGPQKQIFHQEFGYVREEPIRWKTLRSGFELRTDDAFLDIGVMTKQVIFKYALEAGSLQRMQPIAMNGIGFIDEWLQVCWDEGRRWSDPSSMDQLRIAHDAIQNANKSAGNISYGALRSCGEASAFEAEVKNDDEPVYFFKLNQISDGFTVLAVSNKQTCFGPNILAKK